MNDNGHTSAVAAVVVGVDGSEGSMAALRWAVSEARLRKAPLRVVHAWTYGFMGTGAGGYGYMGGFGSYSAAGIDLRDIQQAAEDLLTQMIDNAVGDATDIEIERRLVEGSAAAPLLAAVAEGDLLVVGSRGHGGFAGLLLGSISQQCVHHATGPVVVVHSAKASVKEHEVTGIGEVVGAVPMEGAAVS